MSQKNTERGAGWFTFRAWLHLLSERGAGTDEGCMHWELGSRQYTNLLEWIVGQSDANVHIGGAISPAQFHAVQRPGCFWA